MENYTLEPPTGKSLRITVENIIKLKGGGNLRAFASVTIEDKLTIHSCRIVQQPSQKVWGSLPQREWTGKDGNKHYAPLIELPDKVKRTIEEAILGAWEQQK